MKSKLFVIITSFIAIVLCGIDLASAIDHSIISLSGLTGDIILKGDAINDLEITPALIFNEIGDSITYKMTLNNPDNNKFQIKSITDSNTNQYITTSYSYSHELDVEDKPIYITFSYSKYVPTEEDLNLNNMKISIDIEEDTPEPEPEPTPGYDISKKVRVDGTDNWQDSATVKPGDTVEYKLTFKNTGNTLEKEIRLFDILDTGNGMEYVEGSLGVTRSVEGDSITGGAIAPVDPDPAFFTEDGMLIGDVRAGETITATYKVKFTGENNEKCKISTLYNNARVSSKIEGSDVVVVRANAEVKVDRTGEECDTPTPTPTHAPTPDPDPDPTGNIEWKQEQTHTKGSSKNIVLKIDYPMSDFTSLKIDGVLVPQEHYTIQSGSTIITIDHEYVDALDAGEHNIMAIFQDGSTVAQTTFTIAEGGTPTPTPVPEPTPTPASKPKTPDTGSKYISKSKNANINYLPYIIICIASLSIIFSLFSSKYRRAHFGFTAIILALFFTNTLLTNQTHADSEQLSIFVNTANITAKPLTEKDTLSISFPNIYNHSSMTKQFTGGDSIILKTIDNKYALIDTGNSNEKIKEIIYNKLKAYQNKTKVTIDYLIISHLDSDHHGNAVSIINDSNITIRNLIIKHEIYENNLSKEDIYNAITTAAKNKNINIITSGDATTQNYMNTLIGNTDYTKLTEGQTIPLGNKVNLYLYNTTNVYAGKQCVKGTMLDWTADITKADLYKTTDNKYVYIDGSEYPNVIYRTTDTPVTKKDGEDHEITDFSKYYYAWKVNWPHDICSSNPNSLAILIDVKTIDQKKYVYFPNDVENAGYSTLQGGAASSQVFDNLTFDGTTFATDITPYTIPAETDAANSVYNKIAEDAATTNMPTADNLNNIVIYQISHHGLNNNDSAIEKLNLNRANGIYAIQEGSRDMTTEKQFSYVKTYWYTLGNIPANRKIRVGDTTNNGTECTITSFGNTNCANY